MDLSQPTIGLRYGLDIEAYHAGPGVSKTGLDDIDRSPAIFYALHHDPNRPPPKERAGQLVGNLAHCAILEPAQFERRYSVHPQMNRNTKAWRAIEDAAGPGMLPIQVNQYDTAMSQAASVNALPEVRDALAIGRAEVSAFWVDQPTGELCRCRPDWVHPLADNRVVLVDVKTVSDASPREFARQVARKSYESQAAFYSDGFGIAAGVEVLAFVFVAVETEFPFAASACMLDDESLASGRRRYRRLLGLYAGCRRTNTWPGYSSAIELISLPKWAIQPESETQ